MTQLFIGSWLFLSSLGFQQCPNLQPGEVHSNIEAIVDTIGIVYTIHGCDALPVPLSGGFDQVRTIRFFTIGSGDGIVDIQGLGVLIAHPAVVGERVTFAGLGYLASGRYRVRVENLPLQTVRLTITPGS